MTTNEGLLNRILTSFNAFYRALPSFTWFYLALPSFTQFYLVLPSFTEFYLVFFPSFTSFYLVLPIFTEFDMNVIVVQHREPAQPMTTTKGLLNAPGQNNCFLNSAVQVRKKPRQSTSRSYANEEPPASRCVSLA